MNYKRKPPNTLPPLPSLLHSSSSSHCCSNGKWCFYNPDELNHSWAICLPWWTGNTIQWPKKLTQNSKQQNYKILGTGHWVDDPGGSQSRHGCPNLLSLTSQGMLTPPPQTSCFSPFCWRARPKKKPWASQRLGITEGSTGTQFLPSSAISWLWDMAQSPDFISLWDTNHLGLISYLYKNQQHKTTKSFISISKFRYIFCNFISPADGQHLYSQLDLDVSSMWLMYHSGFNQRNRTNYY